jgi:hypothetical protein
MALFKKMDAQPAYLKMGIYGETGSGTTFTASHIAKGLAQLLAKSGHTPPVMFLDTETGSTWVRPIFEDAGIEFFSHSTRAFSDLKQAVVEAEAAKAILIVDSMTHFWEEIRAAFTAAKRERTKNKYARLELPDWNIIKPEWGTFTSAYLNSKCHIILLGRAGSIYEFQENEETHKKEMITAGTRMAAEKGMGYEPSILVEMTSRQSVGPRKARTIIRTATVLKDRADVLDGQQFDDPTFENFLPHIARLNLGGAGTSFDETRSSEALFAGEGNGRDTSSIRRRIVIDEIEALLLAHGLAGASAEVKLNRMNAMKTHFGTVSKTEIEELMSLDQLKLGFFSLKNALEPHVPITAELLDDEIPALAKGATTNDGPAVTNGTTGKPKVRVKANAGPSLKETLKASLAITEPAE